MNDPLRLEDLKIEQLSIKEAMVTLPIFGAMLAITYDVGFFYGIGLNYFTMFSLSEHILFAFEVIPVAFGVAMIVPSGILGYRVGWNRATASTPPIPTGADIDELKAIQQKLHQKQKKEQRKLLLVSVVALAAGIGAIFLKAYFFAGTVFVIGIGGLLSYFIPGGSLRTIHFVLWYVFAFLVISFSLGIHVARSTLEATKPVQSIAIASQQELKGLAIRSGERGILFFDTTTRKINFLIWSDIKRIQDL